jgi:hypothetical protein
MENAAMRLLAKNTDNWTDCEPKVGNNDYALATIRMAIRLRPLGCDSTGRSAIVRRFCRSLSPTGRESA